MNLLLCLGLVAAAMVLAWPLGDISYADDFAYTDIALKLVHTGHIIYNGWEFAILLAHAWWGALFIRLFGFSFQCVRFSTIPFALGAVGVCYLLLRRAGLKPLFALLVTLLLGLSPLFVPLSVSYMTDIPCLFYTLASLYSLARAGEEGGDIRGYAWLLLGAATGFVGGTGRQVVWLVPLTVLPYLAWMRRREPRFAATSAAMWVLILGGAAEITAWFNSQPYSVEQLSVLKDLNLAMRRPLWVVNLAARLLLILFLMVIPAAVPLLFRARRNTWRGTRARQLFVGFLLVALLVAIFVRPSLASIPWVYGTLDWEGSNGSAPMPGRPIVLIRPVRALVAMAVYVSACLLAGELFEIRRLARRAWNFLKMPDHCQFALAAMTMFSVTYFVLLLIRGSEIDIFDRYLLPVMPWAATVLLLWFEAQNHETETIQRRAMPIAWVALAVLALYAVASTQDLWSLARARVAATKRLEAAGIPRTAIDAGMDYNGWTQLLVNGRLNDRWVKNPPGAYRPQFGRTPEVTPVYVLEYQPANKTTPSQFGSVPYYSLLPPFRKQVSIDKVVGH